MWYLKSYYNHNHLNIILYFVYFNTRNGYDVEREKTIGDKVTDITLYIQKLEKKKTIIKIEIRVRS